MKKLVHFCLLSSILFVGAAPANAEVIRIVSNPTSREISQPGQLKSVTKDFVELEDGTYGLSVSLSFQEGRFQKGTRSVYFTLNEGHIIRENNDLFFENDGAKTFVAHHEWWYSPSWQATNGARLEADLQRVHDGSAWETYSISAALILP